MYKYIHIKQIGFTSFACLGLTARFHSNVSAMNLRILVYFVIYDSG